MSVISMGLPQAKTIIREAFSMVVDSGTLMSDRKFGGADVLATSCTLAQGVRALGDFDLILRWKQTTDGGTAQVGSEMSEWLGIPCVANVMRIVEAGEKDIFMPRLPSYVKKAASANREIKILSLADMEDRDESNYGLAGSPTKVQRIFPPESNVQHGRGPERRKS